MSSQFLTTDELSDAWQSVSREREKIIAQAAYYRAEWRGFSAGDPQADWLASEAEVDAIAGSQLAIANPANPTFQQQLDARQSLPTASPLAQPLSRTDVIFSVVTALAGVGMWAFFIYILSVRLQPPTLF